MTPTRRIFINIVASHGRSIFVLACGFLTSRWALKVLGNESYGLLNLIGGMAIIISLLNTSLAISTDRFFAYAIGEEATNKCESNSCQRWFNLALAIHIIIATTLVAIGYSLFAWLIRNYIKVSSEIINASISRTIERNCAYISIVAIVVSTARLHFTHRVPLSSSNSKLKRLHYYQRLLINSLYLFNSQKSSSTIS